MRRRPALRTIVRSRLLPWMVLPLVLLLAGLCVFLARSRLDSVREQDSILAASLSRYVENYLDGATSALGYLNRLKVLSGGKTTMAAAVRSLQADLRFERVLLLDQDDIVTEAFPEGRPGLDFPLYFPETADKTSVISQPLFSTETGSMTIFMRHRDDSGSTVVGELDLGHLQQHIASFARTRLAEVIILTDAFGNVIAHPEQELMRRQANLGNMALLRGLEDRTSNFSMFLQDGKAWIGTAATIGSLGWRLIILKPAEAVLKPIAALAAMVLAVCLAYVGFLAWLIQGRLRRHIETPVQSLTQAIQNMAHGDFGDFDPGTGGFSELEMMAREFRTMARTVAEREEALRRSREKYRSIFENAAEGIIQVTASGSLLSANPAAARIFGFETPDEAIEHYTDLAHQLFLEPAERADLLERLEREGPVYLQVRVRRRDGEVRWLEAHARPVNDDAGNLVYVESILHDVTDRNATTERLQASLEEKEILLKEIHHRVKNNLQIISSLLYLQSLNVEDPETQGLFHESQSRIATMALVHEELYRSEDFSRIDLRAYAQKLLSRLMQGLGVTGIRVDLKAEPLLLPLQSAIPCGLILNELATNAIKHAFKDKAKGLLRLSIWAADKQGLLVLEDDGPGLPEGFDPFAAETLGMQLVTRLAAQLHGGLTTGRSAEGGARFEIAFPLEESGED